MATKREIRTYAQINNCSIQEARDHFINEAKKRRGVPEHADDFANKRYKPHDWTSRKAIIDADGTFVQCRTFDSTYDTCLTWFNIGIASPKSKGDDDMKNPIAEFIEEHGDDYRKQRAIFHNNDVVDEDTPAKRMLGDVSSAYAHYMTVCYMRAQGIKPYADMDEHEEQQYAGIFVDYVQERCREVFPNTAEVLLEYSMMLTGDSSAPVAYGCRKFELRDKEGVLITDLPLTGQREGVTLH